MVLRRQITCLFRYEKVFALLLFCVPMLVVFCVLFVYGVINNNTYVLGEDEYTSLRFGVTITDETVTYADMEATVCELMEQEGYPIRELELTSYVPSEYSTQGVLLLYVVVDYEDGRYIFGDTLESIIRPQIVEGRLLTEEELNSDKKMAVIYDHIYEQLIVEGESYEIVGERYVEKVTGELPVLIVPVDSFRERHVDSLNFCLTRILSNQEIRQIAEQFEKLAPGNVEIYCSGADDGELRMTFRTVAIISVLIVFISGIVLVMIYSYLLNKHRYRFGVWKVMGATPKQVFVVLIGEIALLGVTAILLGSGVFFLVKEAFLQELYPYMQLLYSAKTYWIVGIVSTVGLLGPSAIVAGMESRKKVRRLL